jgi:hypothetical protein
MRSTLATLALAAGVSACGLSAAGAQAGFSIDWYSLDGGGVSTSDDLSLRLSGSIGQLEPDVIALCSAQAGAECIDPVLQLTGGFWAGFPAAPGGSGPGCDGVEGCIFADGFEPVDAGTSP